MPRARKSVVREARVSKGNLLKCRMMNDECRIGNVEG
jgi:hypothetical protein